MDTKMMLTEPLIAEWLKHIQDVNSEQESIIQSGREFFIPFMAIPMPVVRTVFLVAKSFDLSPKTKYLSLYIYEKFTCNYFWEIYKEYEERPHSEEYKRACIRAQEVSILRLMSCIQLASKMDSHTQGLSISQVLSALLWLDHEHEYTRSIVYTSEIKVFKVIDFKIPLVTPLDCIEVLLVALNLAKMEKLHKATVAVLDITYLQHQQLFSQLQALTTCSIAKTKEDKINFMTMESDILLISAAVIMCTMQIFNVKDLVQEGIVKRLEELVKIDRVDIGTLGKMIFTLINPADF